MQIFYPLPLSCFVIFRWWVCFFFQLDVDVELSHLQVSQVTLLKSCNLVALLKHLQ